MLKISSLSIVTEYVITVRKETETSYLYHKNLFLTSEKKNVFIA